jgi:hypothetical protein
MANTTEVFFHDNVGKLNRIVFYYSNGLEFVKKVNKKYIKVFCVIENETIIYTSREFQAVEDSIDRLLSGLFSQVS